MAGLVGLGQPFGSPSRLINVGAPAGIEQAIATQTQGLNQLGAGLGTFIGQRRQDELEDKDRAKFGQAIGLLQGEDVSQEQISNALGLLSGVESRKFSGILDQLQAQRFGRALDPTGERIRTGQAGKLEAEREKLERPDVISPTQQIAQEKLNTIRRIQSIPPDRRTPEQKESLKRLIEGQAAVQINLPRPAAASERAAIAETNASLDALENLEELFNRSTTKTGPLAGRFETAKGFFGLSSDDQENLLAATAAFKNKVIKDITGAQMSEQEANRIMKQIPLETDPPARWRAKKKQTEINLRAIQKRRIQVLQQSGLLAPGSEAPPIQAETQEEQTVEEQVQSLDEQIKALESQQQQFQSDPRTGIQPLRF